MSNIDDTTYKAGCEAMIERASELAEQEKYLDSATLFIGYGLASGIQEMPPSFFEWRDKLIADPDVQILFKSLSVQSKEEAEAAVEAYAALSAKADEGRFALQIFRANMQESLEKPNDAVDSFKLALTQQPIIVGAWKDLGDIYYQMYLPSEAWACWDAGRSLNPEHKLFEEINEMESALMADHPEYFMGTTEDQEK
ncbi:hypothetical protein P4C99_02925 [Pontiellaceae bacterium B1224]|nr:hypothetical protein [Pontiellaceae bacterium B1224]